MDRKVAKAMRCAQAKASKMFGFRYCAWRLSLFDCSFLRTQTNRPDLRLVLSGKHAAEARE
jgi:hypothetical protein